MSGVQSIERAFAILRVLARGPLGVTDIAERTALPKSTVSRLLTTLEHEGAVVQSEVGRRVRDRFDPGNARRGRKPHRQSAFDRATRSSRSSRCSPVAVQGSPSRERGRAYWVDNVDDTDEMVKLADQTGQSFPLHAVPTGLAMLAKFSDEDLDDYFASSRCRAR